MVDGRKTSREAVVAFLDARSIPDVYNLPVKSRRASK
jgi:hypothetical protein